MVVPEASARPVTTRTAPQTSFVQSPVPAPPHGGSLDREAEFAAMKAQFVAFQLAEERRQTEVEALKSANARLLGEVGGSLSASRVHS